MFHVGSITKARLIEVMHILGEELTPDEADEMLKLAKSKKDFVQTLTDQVTGSKTKSDESKAAAGAAKPAAAAASSPAKPAPAAPAASAGGGAKPKPYADRPRLPFLAAL